MAKLDPLSDINATYGATSALNANFDAIEDAMDNTLSRDGSSPNNMEVDLDMDHNRIVNVGDAISGSDAPNLDQIESLISAQLVLADLGEVDVVPTTLVLAALTPINGQAAFLTQWGRAGLFVFDSSNKSTEVALDPQGGVFIPPASDTDGSSGAWVRRAEKLTPYMFGAVGDSVTDDLLPLQHFYDFAGDPLFTDAYYFDWSGEWATSATLYIWMYQNPAHDQNVPKMRMRIGNIRLLAQATPLQYVLEYAGCRYAIFEGVCTIQPQGATSYGNQWLNKRYWNGIRRRFCSQATWEGGHHIDDARRYAAFDDSDDSTGAAFSITTATGLTKSFTTKSNIGMRGGFVVSRDCGSMHLFPSDTVPDLDGIQSDVVSNTQSGSANSNAQRSTVVVSSALDWVGVEDIAMMRHILAPAQFGTLAVDATAKTITRTVGTWAGDNVAVGDIYYIETDSTSDATNEGVAIYVTSITGGGGTVLSYTVFDKDRNGTVLTTQPASATLKFVSDWYISTVKTVNSTTSFSFFPWFPQKANSDLYWAVGGVLNLKGRDSANTYYTGVQGFRCPTALWFSGLYGPRIGTIKTDHGFIGIRLGTGATSSTIAGTVVEQCHLEGTQFHVYNHSLNSRLNIKGASVLFERRCVVEGPRSSVNSPYDWKAFGLFSFDFGGRVLHPIQQTGFEGSGDYQTYYLSNEAQYNDHVIPFDTETVTVRYDRHLAMCFPGYNKWRAIWIDTDGSAPDGTLTLELHADMIAQGWTFHDGSTSLALTATTPVILHGVYLHSTKKLVVIRLNGA